MSIELNAHVRRNTDVPTRVCTYNEINVVDPLNQPREVKTVSGRENVLKYKYITRVLYSRRAHTRARTSL